MPVAEARVRRFARAWATRYPHHASLSNLFRMQLEFFGAAREVTGSCHVLRANGKTILLDCGLFQGRRSETAAKNARLPVPATDIDAVVLSHAHIDHAGRLPLLIKEGFTRTISATAATRD